MISSWQTKRIKFCDTLIMGQSPDGASVNSEGNGVPFLQGNAEFGELHPTAKHATTEPGKLCSTGDVLLSVRAPVGAVNVADQIYAIGRGLCAIRPKLHDGNYLRYLLTIQSDVLNSIATGTTFTAVSTQQVGNIHVPLTSTDEQRRIAAYLDEQTVKIDRLMDMRRRQMALLKEQRAALIQQAVTRGLNPNTPMKDSGLPWLGEIPAHWKVAVLKWQMQIASGDSVLTEALLIEPDGISNVPAIGGNGVMGFTAKSNVSSPILAIGRVGALCGNVHLVPPPAWITDNALMVFDVRGYSLEFLWRLLTVLNMNRLANHNAQPLITGTLVKNQRAPLPPLEEQREILEFIQVESAKFDALHVAYARQLTLLAEYRAALIHECVTGQRSMPELVNT